MRKRRKSTALRMSSEPNSDTFPSIIAAASLDPKKLWKPCDPYDVFNTTFGCLCIEPMTGSESGDSGRIPM
jgi:hypothetical protein